MDYIFRKMQRDDAPSLWSLCQGIKQEQVDMSFAGITQMEEILAFADNPLELTYVAASKAEPDKAVCIVKGRRDPAQEKRHAVFLSAATHPYFRGQGLAARLTDFALQEMKKEGITIARIYVYSDNRSSVNAVKKLDFTLAGVIQRHHRDLTSGDYIDDLIFHKILD